MAIMGTVRCIDAIAAVGGRLAGQSARRDTVGCCTFLTWLDCSVRWIGRVLIQIEVCRVAGQSGLRCSRIDYRTSRVAGESGHTLHAMSRHLINLQSKKKPSWAHLKCLTMIYVKTNGYHVLLSYKPNYLNARGTTITISTHTFH